MQLSDRQGGLFRAALERRHLLDALGAWSLSLLLMLAAAQVAGFAPFDATSYLRFDSGHYLAIGQTGYEFYTCRDFPEYPPEAACGNAGWFPGYPLLIHLLTLTGLGAAAAGILVTNIFAFIALLLLRALLERVPIRGDKTLLFYLGAVFPGGMYFHAIFPISMFMAFTLAMILLLVERRYLGAALAAALAAFVYSTGFLLSAVVGFGVLVTAVDWPWRKRALMGFLYGGIALSGLLAVLLLHHVLLGHWDAFFQTQAKYGHGINNPFAAFPRMWEDFQRLRGDAPQLIAPLQSLLMGAVCLGALCLLLARWRTALPVEWIVGGQVAIFWLFPIIMGAAVSLTRAEANLLPLVLLLALLPRVGQIGVLVLFSILRFEGGLAFFRSTII